MAESKLLKLKTDLKSLKFENGNEPYILFPIGYTKSFEKNDSIPQSISDFYLSNRVSPDFPLRGGTVSVDLRTLSFTQASQIDKERIRKFLNDKPKGSMFLLKQAGLQLSNPKIETEGILPGLSGGIENTRFYNNGINTLAQVGVQGTGIHGVRHGAIPFNPLQKAYYATVNEQNINAIDGYKSNRLIALKQLKLSNNPDLTYRNTAARLGISLSQNNLFQYLGGPDSVYGVGSTTIRRYVNTEDGVEKIAKGPNNAAYSSAVKRTYRDIDQISEALSTVKDGVQTFKLSGRSSQYGIGDPGNRAIEDSGIDRMNANTLLYYDSNQAPWQVEQDKVYSKDIIKFVFEAVDNDNTQNATAVFFRAFLSSMTDNHTANINTYKYLGRGEEFYTHHGASRQIGFSFKIAPQSDAELKPLYKKLNYLISQVYSDYSYRGIMRAPLMKITIGDYFYRLPGFIESINISVDDNVPWEIEEKDNYEDVLFGKRSKVNELRQLPHVINVQCNFKPIHDFLPRREKWSSTLDKGGFTIQRSQLEDMNVPFIVNDNTEFIKGQVFDNTVKIKQNLDFASADNEINQNFQADNAPVPPPYINPFLNTTLADQEINRRFSRAQAIASTKGNKYKVAQKTTGTLTKQEEDLLRAKPQDLPWKTILSSIR